MTGYFQALNPVCMAVDATAMLPVCGRGRHLLRMAIRDGSVTIDSVPDTNALWPVLQNGYAEAAPDQPGAYVATGAGRTYLDWLASVK